MVDSGQFRAARRVDSACGAHHGRVLPCERPHRGERGQRGTNPRPSRRLGPQHHAQVVWGANMEDNEGAQTRTVHSGCVCGAASIHSGGQAVGVSIGWRPVWLVEKPNRPHFISCVSLRSVSVLGVGVDHGQARAQVQWHADAHLDRCGLLLLAIRLRRRCLVHPRGVPHWLRK